MMKKYEVEIKTTIGVVVFVDAENEEEAGKIALKEVQDVGAEDLPGEVFLGGVVSYAKEDI